MFEGPDTAGAVFAAASGDAGPALLVVSSSLVDGGLYTVEFHNTHNRALDSSSFGDDGGENNTWVRVRTFADYLVISDAQIVTLRSYVRHFPGPAFAAERQTVIIQIWEEGDLSALE